MSRVRRILQEERLQMEYIGTNIESATSTQSIALGGMVAPRSRMMCCFRCSSVRKRRLYY
eukprot:1015951-Amphidinium_carterae.1